MKKIAAFLLLLLNLVSEKAKGDHFPVSIEDFETLEIRVHGSVDWTSSPATASVDCSSALFSELEFEQNGKILTINWKNSGRPDWKSGNNKLDIHLSSEMLRKVIISGSADFTIKSSNKTPEFTLNISGSGDFTGNLDCSGPAAFLISGSGDIRSSGTATDLNVKISGSGDFKGKDLKSEKVQISISGSGDAEVFALNELDASVSGSGDIRFRGKPAKLKKKVSGSGSIQAMQ